MENEGSRQISFGFRREYWCVKDVLDPCQILKLKAGSFVCPEGALGGDGAPACATNSSEQDDHVKAIWIPIREEGVGREDTTLHGLL